jgi:4-amino-4-deoxy-L-arabinose transferase-like glycosyltransferase
MEKLPARDIRSFGCAQDILRAAAWAVVILMALLRVVALDSDAYPRLSWSSALLTDEGFYIHDARNLVLFGHAQTDGFSNRLIMPTLHCLQVAVFSLCGVGAVQARLISVALSLLMLAAFFAALRRAFGRRVAWAGVALLGLDHVSLLYHRLALMDTPAACVLVFAFYAFVRGTEERERVLWLFGCGLLLGLACTVRGLSALVWPAPLAALWWSGREAGQSRRRAIGAVVAGLAAALLIYLISWYLPHHAELARVNRYYVGDQLVPHRFAHLRRNVAQSLYGWQRGMMPYLLRHTPVQFGLTLLWLLWWKRGGLRTLGEPQAACARYLALWLLLVMLPICCVNYAPSRYYVLFYPAMAGLAAIAAAHFDAVVPIPGRNLARMAPAVLLLAWGLINLGWLGDWLLHLTYRQREADRWLADHLPPNSVLLGAVAPGLCMNNRFQAVNVIEDLCNDDRPVERFAPAPRYILILDGRWKEVWWVRNYPELVAPDRRIHAFPHLLRSFFSVGVYPVPVVR